MEVSKLTISPENLRFTKMSRSRRAELRKRNIVDLIQSRPYGKHISLKEFAFAAATKPTSVPGLLKSLEKKGKITRTQISSRRSCWSVNGDVKLVKIPSPEPVFTTPLPEPISTPTTESWTKALNEAHLVTTSGPDILAGTALEAFGPKVERLAKDFSWSENSDSLRDFVTWLGSRGQK